MCAWGCGCIFIAFIAGPPGPTDAIWTCSAFTAACSASFCALAAALSSLSCDVASVDPSSERWISSRLFSRPCGTPISLFALRRRSDATNTVHRLGSILQSGGIISHSLQSSGYNPDLCRFRYDIPIASISVMGRGGSAFPCSC